MLLRRLALRLFLESLFASGGGFYTAFFLSSTFFSEVVFFLLGAGDLRHPIRRSPRLSRESSSTCASAQRQY